MTQKFIADVHLGKLARLLRLLDFDTPYGNDYSTIELLQISQRENRWLLSRNSFSGEKMEVDNFIIKSKESLQQLREVIDHFNFKYQLDTF
jgi:uncharacterized protein with PIN domain